MILKDDKLLTTAQVAERLGLKAVTVRAWIARRVIPSVKIGTRAIRIPATAIARLIENGYTPAAKERGGVEE
jgi:excisionase family DNA binding protein